MNRQVRDHNKRPFTVGDAAAVCMLLATATLLGLAVGAEWLMNR